MHILLGIDMKLRICIHKKLDFIFQSSIIISTDIALSILKSCVAVGGIHFEGTGGIKAKHVDVTYMLVRFLQGQVCHVRHLLVFFRKGVNMFANKKNWQIELKKYLILCSHKTLKLKNPPVLLAYNHTYILQ